MRKPWLAVALVGILGLGLGLRLHGYTTDPAPADNYDGLNWAWNGQSLILKHVPQGWSWLPSYHPTVFMRRGPIFLPEVSPFFDHPPLFGLLVGGLAVLAGEHTPDQISEAVTRLVPILLSLVTILLTYCLVRRVTGRQSIGLLTALALAVAPAVVLTSRLVESEALLTPLLLAAVLLALRIRDGAGRWSVIALVTVCAASVLTKEVGVVVAVIAAVILLFSQRRLLAMWPLLGLGAGIAIYLVYAAAIDWHQFVATVMALGDKRGPAWLAFVGFFTSTSSGLGVTVPLVDPVWYLGWVALAGLAVWRSDWRTIAFAAFVYAAIVCSLANGIWMHLIGWYRIPDEPFLYAASVAALCLVLRPLWARLRPHPRAMGRQLMPGDLS